jgi:hypothetical protein
VTERDKAQRISGPLHGGIHRLTEGAVRLFNSSVPNLQPYARAKLPPWDYLTVFLHVPRTAGDAMRTHLFNAADLDFTPFEAPPQPLSDEELAQLGACRFIKGFLSIRDVARLPSKRRVFTFLRDPVERSLSLYYFLGQGRRPTKRTLSIQELFRSDNPLLASYARNGMTWQLGDTLNIEERTLSGPQALERAKATLKSMDFVGFYEDLLHDFRGVRRELFPDLRIHSFFPALFTCGALLTTHRRSVRKYASTVTADELALVREANALDSELYAFAREQAGRSAVMHDTYAAWARAGLR